MKIAKASGPLLDAGLRIDAVAVHLFGELEPDGSDVAVSGGVHVELVGLGVPLGGGGGDNTGREGRGGRCRWERWSARTEVQPCARRAVAPRRPRRPGVAPRRPG